MKILYIASGTKLTGGATKSFLSMLAEAKKAGVEYEVVCPDGDGLTAHLQKLGIKVHIVPYRHACLPPHRGWKNKLKWIPRIIHNRWINHKAHLRITKIARLYSPDIIHENSSAIDVGYHASKKTSIPDVIHIREYGDLDFQMHLPGRDRRLTDLNVYTIPITKDIASYKNQHDSPRSVQLYNGIIREGQIRYTSQKKPYFLYAGRIEEAKGVDMLIDAYTAYARTSVNPFHLYLAGGCNYPDFLDSLKKKIEKNGLSSLVTWLGERNDTDNLMYTASATIIPSEFEALGRVMPEAMANGSLCIGRNTGGTKEQMDNGRRYIGKEVAYSFESVNELTKLLTEVADKAKDPATFEINGIFYNMIKDSQKVVLEFFSESRFGEKLIDFYNKILSERDGNQKA